jgi:hypothetical protein
LHETTAVVRLAGFAGNTVGVSVCRRSCQKKGASEKRRLFTRIYDKATR